MARSSRSAADPTRRAAFASGLFYLITFASSIPAALMLAPILEDPRYITGPGQDTQILVACLLDLVNAFTAVGSAVAVFSVLRRFHESLALGFVATRLLEAATIIPGVIALIAVVSIREAGPVAGMDPAATVAVGRGLVGFRDWTFILGPGLIPGFNALMFATILYRTRLVPRWISALGLIGAPLLITSAAGVLLGLHQLGSTYSALATLPIFVWELSVGLWMTLKGFDRRVTMGAPGADAAEARGTEARGTEARGADAGGTEARLAVGEVPSAAPALVGTLSPDAVATPAAGSSWFRRVGARARRRHLLILVGLWFAFVASGEARDHGVTTATVILFALTPRLPLLLGLGHRTRPGFLAPHVVLPFNLAHEPLVPAALFTLGATGILGPVWLVGGLAWTGQMVIDWALGDGLRTRDGSVRPGMARLTLLAAAGPAPVASTAA